MANTESVDSEAKQHCEYDSLLKLRVHNELCGTQVVFTRAALQHHANILPLYPNVAEDQPQACSTLSGPEIRCIGTLRPTHSLIVTCVVDELGGTYVHIPTHDSLFSIRPSFDLRQSVPKNSVVHAFVYVNDGSVHLGVFDISQLSGVDFSQRPPMERHQALHTHVTGSDHVYIHWAGFEAALREGKCDTPFDVEYLMRLPEKIDTVSTCTKFKYGTGQALLANFNATSL